MAKLVSVTGLGFGDEGKGATVDWACRNKLPQGSKPAVVIRHNGGPQCSHAVITPEGRTHLFHQFGSGTLAGAATYLDQDVIIDPIALEAEGKSLEKKTEREVFLDLFIHPDCMLTTMFQRLFNHAAVQGRTSTCGFGVGATRKLYLENPEANITVKDLYGGAPDLYRRLGWLRDRLCYLAYEMNVDASLLRATKVEEVYSALNRAAETIFKHNSLRKSIIQARVTSLYVYEGAQGVLLDQDYGFQPYTTWSDLTSYSVSKSIAYHNLHRTGLDQIEHWGVIRAYHTRHGDGPFPTELSSSTRVDRCNPSNQYQGAFRFGRFDSVLMRYAVQSYEQTQALTGIVINHMDEYPRDEQVVTNYSHEDHSQLHMRVAWKSGAFNPAQHPCRLSSESIGAYLQKVNERPSEYKVQRVTEAEFPQYVSELTRKPVVLTGHGPTHADKEVCTVIPVSLQKKESVA